MLPLGCVTTILTSVIGVHMLRADRQSQWLSAGLKKPSVLYELKRWQALRR
jgi:hypothetical protein